jgi:hypothetical protein
MIEIENKLTVVFQQKPGTQSGGLFCYFRHKRLKNEGENYNEHLRREFIAADRS